ncbi:MAG: ribosome biogenesis GTP-binding protein YihA/YsxC [Myxococcales bacterium]|nr:ribosome biogenesis GTP-binding protein YihA/YsxC [Myxococcales bacterium]
MKTTFITSGPKYDALPNLCLPEIAFIGRSNVGKSSLLNALVSARIARTSGTPGRTQLINLFRVHAGFGDFALADLPGYGFAKAPKAVREGWGAMVESYLARRENLHAVLLLLDARRGVQADDRQLYDVLYPVLRDRGALSPVVLTKIDKLVKSQRKPAALRVAKDLGISPKMVAVTSSSLQIGLQDLRQRVQVWVEGRNVPQER